MRASNGAFTVESAGWEGGRLLPGTGNDKVLYHITDHLGSVRAVKDGAGNILQRIDYYPFGSVSSGWSSSTTPAQPTIRYRFSGKEIAGQSIGASAPAGIPATAAGNPYLDFSARLYDPRTASWLSHDLLAEKYYGISSFAYCAGDPVNLMDQDGLYLYIGEYSFIEGLLFDYSGNLVDFDVLDDFTSTAFNTILKIYETDTGKTLIDELQYSDFSFTIKSSESSRFKQYNTRGAYALNNENFIDVWVIGSGGDILWNPSSVDLFTQDGLKKE